jgi:hypothetical protein
MPNEKQDPTYNSFTRKIKRKWRITKQWSGMMLHRMVMRILFTLGIGWWVQKKRCQLNIYKKFSDGRCMYCGKVHHEIQR